MWKKPVAGIALLNAGVALLAFLKDLLLAAYAGTSVEADALTIAYFLPDSLGNNVLAAAIAVVCVPLFARLAALNRPQRLRRTLNAATVFFLALSVVLVLAGYLFSERLIHWFAMSESSQALAHHALPLFRILLPSLVLFMVAAVGTAVLQTFGRFLVPAMAPLFGHLVVVTVAAVLIVVQVPPGAGIRWIAAALTGGVLVMATLIGITWARTMRQSGGLQDQAEDVAKADVRRDVMDMLRLLAPYAIVLASTQAVHLAERYLLTNAEAGAAAALNYAYRLSQLPTWIFVAAISVVMLPSLARHLAREEWQAAHRIMNRSFQATVLIVMPLMLYLFVLREPITVALFRRGAFDDHSVHLTAGMLEGYALTIIGHAFSFVCLRYFLAARTLVYAVLIHLVTGGITVWLDWALLPAIGVKAIGYAAAIGTTLNAVLVYMLYRKTSGVRPTEHGWVKRHAATLLPTVLLLAVLDWAWCSLDAGSSGFALGFVALTGCLYLAVYFLLVKKWWADSLRSLLGGGG